MAMVWEGLDAWAAGQGLGLAHSSPAVLDIVKADLEARRATGEIDAGLWGKMLDGAFRYFDGVAFPVSSVIMFTKPRPAHYAIFNLPEGLVRVPVPPTYADYNAVARELRESLLAGPLAGAQLAPLRAPLKNVASRLGLVVYGRNNITYCPGAGSYHELMGYVCSVEPPGTGPGLRLARPPETAPECEGCDQCREACPTGAIPDDDRFVLKAGRCLTFLNESTDPWPEWLPSSVHHALVGCLICQEVCPMNCGRLRYEDLQPTFGVEETAWLLRSAGATRANDPLAEAIKAKFEAVGLPGYETIAGRNLAAFLAARRATSTAGG
jgi:epoxyqueuosine reductase